MIVLVDRNAQHVWKPRLHEVAAGAIDSDDAVSYLGHSVSHGYTFHLGTLVHVDAVQRRIRLSGTESKIDNSEILNPPDTGYDILVLALGSGVNDFGISGVVAHCQMLDSAAQAQQFQQRFLEATIQVTEGRRDQVRVGIVVAGSTGVELAAQLRKASHDLQRYGGLADQSLLDITLVDGATRILPALDPGASASIAKTMERLRINIILGHQVDYVTAEALHLKDGESSMRPQGLGLGRLCTGPIANPPSAPINKDRTYRGE